MIRERRKGEVRGGGRNGVLVKDKKNGKKRRKSNKKGKKHKK
ncbi:MAG: hypothetical protein R3Y24_11655 [Eubacteriales bacterium]